MLLTVTYHYVRSLETSKYPGIYSISPQRLSRQIEYLANHFSIVGSEDLAHVAQSNKPNNYCFITFDDGLREQYETALPILDSHNIKPMFFVNGVNTSEKTLSLVHKLQWIRSTTQNSTILGLLYREIDKLGIDIDKHENHFSPIDGENMYDESDVQRVKYLLFHVLTDSQRKTVVEMLYRDTQRDEREHAESLYMDKAMLKDLGKRKCLGSHGWDHEMKTSKTRLQCFKDFEKNQQYLEKLTGNRVVTVSYPKGGRNAVSLPVSSAARQAGHRFGFSIERALETSFKHPLLLPRLDANDLPYGKRPLFDVVDSRLSLKGGVTLGSTWFR